MGVLTRGDTRRRLLLSAAALGLAIAALVIVPNTSASGEEATSFGEPAGVLLLGVDSAAESVRVEYYPDADSALGSLGSIAGAQAIDIRRCAVLAETGSLLEITASGPGNRGVGAVSNGLGVRTKNNCSTAQGRINSSQSLTFRLGDGIADDVRIRSVEVDVEGKFGADLRYALDGGDYVVPSEDLPNTSDNGPDAGVGDNNAAKIAPSVYFTSITFSADGGEVAIEAGGDGELPVRGDLQDAFTVNESVFELETVRLIECGVPEVEGGGAQPLATLTLLGPTGCPPIPIAFRTDLESVFLDKPEGASGTFTMRIAWDREDAGPVDDLKVTKIDFDGDGGDLPEDVQWCNGTTTNPLPLAGVPWCLYQQTVTLDGPDEGVQQILVTEDYLGTGDPRWAR